MQQKSPVAALAASPILPLDSLLCFPSVQLLGTTVPKGYYVIHIANEDGVMCKVEKSGLLAQHLLCRQVFQS